MEEGTLENEWEGSVHHAENLGVELRLVSCCWTALGHPLVVVSLGAPTLPPLNLRDTPGHVQLIYSSCLP